MPARVTTPADLQANSLTGRFTTSGSVARSIRPAPLYRRLTKPEPIFLAADRAVVSGYGKSTSIVPIEHGAIMHFGGGLRASGGLRTAHGV